MLTRRARIEGHEIAHTLRPGGSTCVLFVHGLGCDKSSFQAAFEGSHFGGEYTLLAPDLLGHGQSDRPSDASYSMEQQSELMLELLRRLGVKRAVVVAHSMGNVPGLLVARQTQNLSAYFCLEGNLLSDDCRLSSRITRYSEADFVEKLFALAPRQFSCRDARDETQADPVALYRSARSLVDWSSGGRLLSMYRGLKCTKAYFYGEESDVSASLEGLVGETVISVPHAGHLPMVDNPHFIYSEIAEQLCRTK